MERFILLPEDSFIPLQFMKESEINLYVGIDVIVLSKFCTWTVERLIDITSPSALLPGILIQSPILTVSFTAIWTLATKPKMVSLKTNNKTAERAPRAVTKLQTSFPVKIDRIKIPPINHRNIMTTWR